MASSSPSSPVAGRAVRRSRGPRAGAAGATPGEYRATVLPADAEGALSRERVGELQCARILAAMTELVRERGAGGVTVAHIVARSGVSRRTFYELFEDREGCLLAAFDQAVARAAAAVLPVYEDAAQGGSPRWEEQLRAGLGALLRFLDDEPAIGGLLVVDSLAAEHRVLARRARIVDTLVDVVHRGARAHALATACESGGTGVAGAARVGRTRGGAGVRARAATRATSASNRSASPRIVAEGAVGAVLAVIHTRLAERNPRLLSGLLNSLMAMVVLPYLGPDAAARELERPTPRARRRARVTSDPLRELDMRLTYRTVRVLLAIAELGGQGMHPSGREVADAAGISDQGQISKLLARLQHLGLIHNSAAGRGKGEPNAWTLADSGRRVEQAIRAQTAS
jgi:AcrR family transcriptional regulator